MQAVYTEVRTPGPPGQLRAWIYTKGSAEIKITAQNAPTIAILRLKMENIAEQGAQPPPQTPLPGGGGHPLHPRLVAWSSGITSVLGRRAFAVLRSACS